MTEATEAFRRHFAGEYPHLAEMATEHIMRPGYDFGSEFEIGLGVILDALTRSIPGRAAPQAHQQHGYAGIGRPETH